jgi:DNA polymerase I
LTGSNASSRSTAGHIEGWIIDLYPEKHGMAVWLKTRDDRTVRLTDVWQQCFYVAGEYSDLVDLASQLDIEGTSFEEKFTKPEDNEPSTVLKIPAQSAHEAERLAERILVYGHYRRYELYNVDVKASQLYMYEKDLYPFGYVEASTNQNGIRWKLQDSLESVDYEVPPLREVTLSVSIQQKGRVPSRSDPVEAITIKSRDNTHHINGSNEVEKLLRLVETIRALDPDIIYTANGDDFLFPYLAYRATVNGIADQLILGRDSSPLRPSYGRGQTYMSYGRVYHRPTPTRLLGRIHIDRENSMLYGDCGLPGIIEVSRLCRIPAQRVSNTTIGTSMTSAQLYEATRRGVLIPWRKTEAEELKTASELLIADRGGFYYEPIIGLHESVGELDFTSLYPMIMLTKNLSGETVRCRCCPNSKNRVPELGYNICEKRIGIAPRSLKLILEKRQRYKELRHTAANPELRNIYEMRQAALKWILVCAFGYLGFKNARFGRVDAHIATCAFARQILRDTVHLAESRGFRLIHGIVDSLWLKKEGATEEDYLRLRAEIEEATGLPISFEGIYRWIVFLPSKTHRNVPVLNRYYGVFRNGKIKDRGIATRRHDTPPIIDRCLREMLRILAEAENAKEFYAKLPSAYEVVEKHICLLRSGVVPLEELTIRKRLSHNPAEYRHRVLQAVAAHQLAEEGFRPNAGESINYIITNNRSKNPGRRVLALELYKSKYSYDSEAYIDLLLSAVETMLTPFGFDKKCLLSHAIEPMSVAYSANQIPYSWRRLGYVQRLSTT